MDVYRTCGPPRPPEASADLPAGVFGAEVLLRDDGLTSCVTDRRPGVEPTALR